MKSSRRGSLGLPIWAQLALDDLTAVHVAAVLGFVWLLAYTFTGWAREASLALIWRLELWVADVLGLPLRPANSISSPNDPVLWVAILVSYCLVSLWLISRAGRPTLSEEDVLGLDSDLWSSRGIR